MLRLLLLGVLFSLLCVVVAVGLVGARLCG